MQIMTITGVEQVFSGGRTSNSMKAEAVAHEVDQRVLFVRQMSNHVANPAQASIVVYDENTSKLKKN